MGKPITQSRNEVKGLQGRIDFFLANVHKVLSEEEAGADADGRVEEKISYEPIGVVGNISAWNYPYFVGSNVFVPALLTGNAVLYKPSEFASLTGLDDRRADAGGGRAGRRLPARDGRRRRGRGAARAAAGRHLLHRLLRHRAQGGGGGGPPADARAARARRQGPGVRLRRRRGRGEGRGRRRRRGLLQQRAELLRGGARVRARAHPRPLRGGVRGRGEALRGRRSHGREDVHRPRRAAGAPRGARGAGRGRAGEGRPDVVRRRAPRPARLLLRAHRLRPRQPPDGADARRDLRPADRHPEGGERRRSARADERHRVRADRERVRRPTATAPRACSRR